MARVIVLSCAAMASPTAHDVGTTIARALAAPWPMGFPWAMRWQAAASHSKPHGSTVVSRGLLRLPSRYSTKKHIVCIREIASFGHFFHALRYPLQTCLQRATSPYILQVVATTRRRPLFPSRLALRHEFTRTAIQPTPPLPNAVTFSLTSSGVNI